MIATARAGIPAVAAILVLGTCSRDALNPSRTFRTSLEVVSSTTVITTTLLTVGTDVVNQRIYTTAPFAPAPNTLITVAVLGRSSLGTPPIPTLSGGGMAAWDVVATVPLYGTTPLGRLTVFRAMSATPGSGPLTITSSMTLGHSQWIVSQWSGVETSGVNGSGAVVQTGSTRGEAVTGLTVPLAAFGHVNNVAYGAFAVNRVVAVITPGAGFTEIAEQPSGEFPPADLQAQWTTHDNTIDATWPLILSGGALGIEIQAAATSGAVDAGQSTVVAAPGSIPVGSGVATITVTAKDANDNPIAGATVVLAVTGSATVLTQPAAPTGADGAATATLSATLSGPKVVSAVIDGTPIVQTVSVTVQPPPGSVVFVGAGDIGDCEWTTDEATATLLDGIPGTVFAAGDNAYPNGSASDYTNCYEPTWGRHKARTRPTPGNHDYRTAGAADYFAYFGASAGPAGLGYYSYDLGDWHIISLNSEISRSVGSPQEVWLRADLAANTKQCTLAYWHKPLFSSGFHGNLVGSKPLWKALQEYNAEVVVVGHDHNYERFAPQDTLGVADPARGLRQFVVGTGGTDLRSMNPPIANSEVQNSNTHGVLKLTLHATGYEWEFIPVAGKTFTDVGSGSCH